MSFGCNNWFSKCVNGTKTINLVVNRNIERFPEDFYFQPTKKEYNNLRFQIETSNSSNNLDGVRKLPYVFVEQGVAMLATKLEVPNWHRKFQLWCKKNFTLYLYWNRS